MNKQPKKQKSTSTPAQVIFWRTILLMGIFGILLFIPLGWKLYQLQIVQHDELQAKATRQQTSDVTVSASRGSIYDTNGKTLAVSATVYNVILSPKDVNTISEDELKEAYGNDYKDTMTEAQIDAATQELVEERIQLIANTLGDILDVDPEEIVERCGNVNSQYSVVKKKVEAEAESQVRTFIERYSLSSCIYLTNDTKRYYPYSSLASNLLGFVNSDNEGAYGLEAMYDSILSGTEGRIVTAKNSKGTDLSYYYSDYYDAEDGMSLYLTIDTTIQYYCEQTLQEGIEKYNVLDGGWCIAMDPNSGAILGMASSPSCDLNNASTITDEALLKQLETTQTELDTQVAAGEITQEEADTQYTQAVSDALNSQWLNLAVNATYEPGSTFKSIVLAAGLEEGVIDEDTSFYCGGSVELDGWPIKCSNRNGHGSLTLAAAVGKSCNMAFIDIGQRLGATKFWEYLEAFGITEKTGIDLLGESNSYLWPESDFVSSSGYVDLAVASFGQRFTLTPIQLITAVSATVNGGYLYQPHVLQSIADADGNVIQNYETTVVRQVISESTSEKVRELLEGVVKTYTGQNAYQAGYRIGGKTGTAQTSKDGTNDDGHWVVSFVGFAPANDPQVVVLLAFDHPENIGGTSTWGTSGYSISGGSMACPLAGELIAEICDYMGVEKQYDSDEQYLADSTMPSVIGYTEDAAAEALTSANLTYRTVGSGDTVTAQVPASGSVLANSSEVVLYMGENASTDTVVMPDLTGMGKSAARQTLEDLGLYYKASGLTNNTSAAADGQSVTAGTEVVKGTVITVHFSKQETEIIE
jgi:stage V sporulation protein D (sporulation-specific penicillin-binding protein)